ncbi:hypothetical protein C1H46_036699 [Malus baccata]|uniref:Origin recognition complex subunit 4 C-terminal domain-containing protein n=1 Tax=Malus baccata TaxID=106549 RepID=A0A540KU85_MALBA|nr:hypothetical protein C1H46_036699 [Malus baccata]
MLNKGLSPSVITYTVLIHAHAAKGRLELAYMYFSEMQEKRIWPNVVTYNALINGLCKVMRMDQAYEYFTEMEDKGIAPNKYTYTILINENCNMGNWKEALRLYKQMLDREIEPDSCTHSALFKHLDKDFQLHAGKQRLLYSLLDAMQSVTSQAVVIGVSSRLDADMLLDKRVRSRFSHRKPLFLPPAYEDIQRLLEHILLLPTDSSFPPDYAIVFNAKLQTILADKRFKEIVNTYLNLDSTVKHLLRYLFPAVSDMDLESGMLSLENFKTTLSNIQRHPKLKCIKVAEYKSIHDSVKTADHFARNVCLRAFEHLLQRELIGFADNRGRNQSVEFSPVKLLVSSPNVMNYIRG